LKGKSKGKEEEQEMKEDEEEENTLFFSTEAALTEQRILSCIA